MNCVRVGAGGCNWGRSGRLDRRESRFRFREKRGAFIRFRKRRGRKKRAFSERRQRRSRIVFEKFQG